MSAEEKIKETLEQKEPPAYAGVPLTPSPASPESVESRMTRLELTVRALREALLVAGREIDDLGDKVGPR